MKATKGYTFNEWSKKFVIEFKGEEGEKKIYITFK